MIDQILANDSSLTSLWLKSCPLKYGVSAAADFIDAFKVNTTIKYVRLEDEFLDALDEEDCCEEFMKHVGKLQSLQKVQLCNGYLDAAPIARLLESATGLQTFEMENVHLMGSPMEFTDFEYSIYKHKSIEKIVLKDLECFELEFKIQDIIKGIATSKSLKVLELHASIETDFMIPAISLVRLRNCKSLEQLHFTGFQLESNAFGMIANMLRNSKLQSLKLCNTGMGDEEMEKINKAVSSSRLQFLDVSGNDIPKLAEKFSTSGRIKLPTRTINGRAALAA